MSIFSFKLAKKRYETGFSWVLLIITKIFILKKPNYTMLPHTHFLFAFLIGEILVKRGIFSLQLAVLTAILAVLIDLDHFIFYSVKHTNLSLKNAWNAAVLHHEQERTFIHHAVGFIIITLIIIITYFINLTATIVLATAYYSHLFLDFAHLNIFKAKDVFRFREAGYSFKIPLYEIIIDILLILIILILLAA